MQEAYRKIDKDFKTGWLRAEWQMWYFGRFYRNRKRSEHTKLLIKADRNQECMLHLQFSKIQDILAKNPNSLQSVQNAKVRLFLRAQWAWNGSWVLGKLYSTPVLVPKNINTSPNTNIYPSYCPNGKSISRANLNDNPNRLFIDKVSAVMALVAFINKC